MLNTSLMEYKRKKLAWIILIFYLMLIYTTLPLVPYLIEWAKFLSRGMFKYYVSILLIFILAVYVLSLFFKSRVRNVKSWFLIFLVMGLYGYLLNVLWIPQERLHLLEYGFLAFLVYKVLKPEFSRKKIYLYTAVMVATFGTLDELIQLFLPNRYYDPKDVIINTISGIMGTIAIYASERG